MIPILILMAVLWFGGARFGWPRGLRGALVAIVWLAVLLALWVLPPEAGFRQSMRGSAGEWLALGMLAGIVWAYTLILRQVRLKARARDATPPAQGTFNATELDRYARHIILREIGGPGQKRMKEARILVVGAGGLGSPALQYLAAAGVGTIGIVDDDTVDNSNLQRQVIHIDAMIGKPKVFSAGAAMKAQNPYVNVRPYHRRLTEDIARDLFADYDLILDGTDNFDTRYMVNRVAHATGKPLVAAALTQWEGQISVFDTAHGTPCYQCIFPQPPAPGLVPSCAEAGVVGPLPGVVGAMMAVEAIKEITGAGETLRGRMLIYDALYADSRIIRLKPRHDCPVCGATVAAGP